MSLKRAFGGALFGALALPLVACAQSTEDVVRTYFASTPVMIEIARCESKFTQFGAGGGALHGGYQNAMVGVFQIYEDIHAQEAAGLGMDIYALDGNLAYAKYLYERQGTTPWLSSFPCWGKEVDVPTDGANENGAITVGLSMGMEHPQVLTLQKILNEKGYTIAESGPGSPGEETQKFGALTRAAVRAFQCAEKIACDGDEHTTGYGFVGAKTRAALASRTVAPPLGSATPDPALFSNYTPAQQKQILELQAQILELTKVLQALIAAKQP